MSITLCPARIDASTSRRVTRVAPRRRTSLSTLRRTGASRNQEPSADDEPRYRDSRRRIQLFSLLQFLRLQAQLGASDNGRTATASRSSGHGCPRGGTRGPNYPIRPLWSAGNKQTTTDHPTSINLPSRSHTPPSPPLALPANHHQPPLQVLDHPHSKLGVGGQAPTPPAPSRSWLAQTAQPSQTRVRDRATSPLNTTPTATAFTTSTRHHSAHAVTPPRTQLHRCRPHGLGSLAGVAEGSRPSRPPSRIRGTGER